MRTTQRCEISIAPAATFTTLAAVLKTLMFVREVLEFLSRKQNRQVPFNLADWRPGDQRVYVSNIAKAKTDFGWEPKTDIEQGLDLLYEWVTANTELFQ
jgi:CDP-paratose 2-epimerase